MKSIAARFFTDREYRVLLSKSGDALCRTFYTLWTLKESYIKAEGRGLSIPLDSFEFELGEVIRLTKNIGEHRVFLFYPLFGGNRGTTPHAGAVQSGNHPGYRMEQMGRKGLYPPCRRYFDNS